MQTNEHLFIPKVWFTLKNMESIWRWIFHQTEDYPYSQWKSGRLFSPSVVCCSCFKLTTRLMPPASSVGDDHAALQQDSIRTLVKFSDPITKEHKKITKRPRKDHTPVRRRGYQTHWWVKDGTRTGTYYLAPASSWQQGLCRLPPRWGVTMQHSSKIQYVLLWSFMIQSQKITRRSE